MDILFSTSFKICLVGQKFKHSGHWYIKLTNNSCQDMETGKIIVLNKDF